MLDPDQLLADNPLILFHHELDLLNEEDELADGFIDQQQLLHVPLLFILLNIVDHGQMGQALILNQPILQHRLNLEYVLHGLSLLCHQVLGLLLEVLHTYLGLLLQVLHQFFMFLIHVNTSNGASLLSKANHER